MPSSRAAAVSKIKGQFGQPDALFGLTPGPKLLDLALDRVRANPDQPRKAFDEEALAELAGSIDRHGLLQPIIVRRLPGEGGYEIIAGERRYRAMQRLGRRSITAILSEGDADELSLIENLQREDLRPLEQAEALARLMDRHAYTQETLAQAVGKARSSLAELLRLNSLPDDLKDACRRTAVSKSVLIELARVPDDGERRALWDEIRAGGTVRDARARRSTARVKATRRAPGQGLLHTIQALLRQLRETKALPKEDAVSEALKQLSDELGRLQNGSEKRRRKY